MKQSQLASWIETLGNTATGFLISIAIQYGVCAWYGLPLRLADNLLIITVFTVASIVRGIAWRRFMEAIGVRMKLSAFAQAVIAERARQISGEGWSVDHDNDHEHGELASAGAAYALSGANGSNDDAPPKFWPWDSEWWKPDGIRRDLVKAGALILAEGERFDRLRKRRRGLETEVFRTPPFAHAKTASEQGGSSA